MEKEKSSIIHNMIEGPLLKQLILFSLPIILGNILQSCYTMADMIIVGNYVGADGLSAVGIGGILSNLILMCGMGMGFGGQILLAQQIGAGQVEKTSRTIGTFMTLSGIFAMLSGILGAAFTGPLVQLLNTPESTVSDTRSYFLICCAGVVFIYGYNCVCAILRGLGESKLPTVFIAIATVVNIVLDLLLIGGFHMGCAGAAIATVTAQGVSFLVSLVCLYRRKEAFHFDFRLESFHIDRATASRILKLSFPMIVFGLMMSVSSIFINSNVNAYGVAASAVDGIGNKLNMVVNAITMGLYTGAGVIVGQCFGAGKPDRIRSVFAKTMLISTLVWAITACFLLLFSRLVFRCFTSDADVLSMARPYLLVASLGYLGMALATGPFALFEGVGNPNLEMISGIIESIVVKILLSLLFQHFLGLYGYWLGVSVASFTTPVIGLIYFFSNRWAHRDLKLPD